MKLVLIIAIALAIAGFANASFNPPHYDQEDPQWGDELLGNGPATIAEQGCVLTATASMLAADGVYVNGRLPNPSTFNKWCKANGCFISGYSLRQDIIEEFGYEWEGYVSGKSNIVEAFNEGKRVILNVKNGRHWVLATGLNADGYTVMDPASTRKTSYSYGEVVKARVYTYTQSQQNTEFEDSATSSAPTTFTTKTTSQGKSASFNAPHFDQDDQRWGDEALGFGSHNIAQKGCFLTAITSMIAAEGISVDGDVPNPEIMNSWFKAHDAFSGGSLHFSAAEAFGFSFEGFETDKTDIIDALNQGKRVILNVLGGSHWVLVTGYTDDGYTVMDPANERKTVYHYNEIVKCVLYTAPTSASAPSAPSSPSTNDDDTNTSFNPPRYLQEDPKWGRETLGNGPATIGQQGCVLTATASMLAADGVYVNGRLPDPSTFNKWCKANGCFIGGYSLRQDIIDDFGYEWEGYVYSKSDIVQAFNGGKRVILNVKNGSHWVLATGLNAEGYTVMDPGSSRRTSYPYREVVKARVYTRTN